MYPRHPVYKIIKTSFPFFDFKNKQRELEFSFKPQMKSTYASILKLLQSVSDQDGLYFSTTRDLTQRIIHDIGGKAKTKTTSCGEELPLNCIDRTKFLINHHAKSNIDFNFDLESPPKFMIDAIQGYHSSKMLKISDASIYIEFTYRRLQNNNGRRFFNRGIDGKGFPANFVEVEMLLKYNNRSFVFYITRGSIPIVFSQLPRPLSREKFQIVNDLQQNATDIENHLNLLYDEYGPNMLLISLLDHCGYESPLSRAFNDAIYFLLQRRDMNEKLKFINYDFHSETKGMQYDNIYQLLESFKEFNSETSYYEFDEELNNIRKQSGVCRVNCVDSLDRTGVVVNMILKYVFTDFLKKLDIIETNGDLPPSIDSYLRNIFADSSDLLSLQYSGTMANKSDFTRTGIRTNYGKMNDMYTSTRRKLFSLTTDPQVEDSYRIFLGKADLGHYFRSSSIFYPYFTNLLTNEILYIILCFTFLFGSTSLIRSIFSRNSSWDRIKVSLTFTAVSAYILNKFSSRLILMPRFLKRN
ncbi:MAG: Phosphatidylinositide phosphatase SAC1 [Marteilia pararefringens]